MSVDAILCYHNHKPYIDRCLDSLKDQVRECIIVDNASAPPLQQGNNYRLHPVFYHHPRKGPANSFNYGAFHSNADWLLYVDPHCVFQPKAILQMQALAEQGEYNLVMGSGEHIMLSPEDPWFLATSEIQPYKEVPLTFLMARSLWEAMGGIPEPPACHMDVLAAELLRQGIQVGWVKGVCQHDLHGSFMQAVTSYFHAGRSYGLVQHANIPAGHKIPDYSQLPRDRVALLVKLLFAAAHTLGAITGLEAVPQEPLDVGDIRFDWVKLKE